MKKTFKLVGTIFYYTFLFVVLLMILLTIIVPDGLLNHLGFGWYRVVSNSMEDKIMVNDFIMAVKTDDEDLEVGDIIIFKTYIPRGGQIIEARVTHYFGGIDEHGNILTYSHRNKDPETNLPIVVNGKPAYDSWKDPDGNEHHVSKDDLMGKVVWIIPTAGFISYIGFVLTNPLGWLLIVMIIASIVTLYIYLSKRKKIRNE